MLRDKDMSLTEIISKLEEKYPLFEFAFFENSDKENTVMLNGTSGSSQGVEIEMAELSEDEKKKQGLKLFIVPRSDHRYTKMLTEDLKNVLTTNSEFWVANLFNMDGIKQLKDKDGVFEERFNDYMTKIDQQTQHVMNPNWNVIDKKYLTYVAYSEDYSDISLTNWHSTIKLKLKYTKKACSPDNDREQERDAALGGPKKCRRISYIIFGMLLNWRAGSSIPCYHGRIIPLSFDDSLPFCLCNYGYGGDQCDVSLTTNPDESLISFILNIAQEYKVPGMFDLQDQVEAQTKLILRDVAESKEEIFTEIRSLNSGLERNRNTVLAAQSLLLNQMKAQSSKVLGGFENLQTAFENALAKESYSRMMASEKTSSMIVHKIVEVAQGITDALVSLDKKTVENRYFDELSLHIPVFQGLFEYATSSGHHSSKHLRESFSEYLHENKHYFYVARMAITHAIIGKPDSYLRAQMTGYMTSGCTDEYNDQINRTWAMLMDLHSSTYIMEYWDLDHRMKKARSNRDRDEIASIEDEIEYLNEKSAIEARLFKEERNSSCPSFNTDELVGGGCKEGFVYRGQAIKNMRCKDENNYVILRSTGTAIKDLVCQDNGEWDIDVEDLTCAQSCVHEDIHYAIGDARSLPRPQIGFRWVNLDGEVIEETLCLYNTSENTADWSHYGEEDIDECAAEVDVCGSHGSCMNVEGSYTCNCEAGFVFIPDSGCQDVNECAAGGEGAISCLVTQQLGLCNNTAGGYQCICLSGAYTTSPRECKACQCDEEGVTTSHCDGNTGECLCREKVIGKDCSACADKYTNFPYCNKCAPGHYQYPKCMKCKCNIAGTTKDICNPTNGRCLCASFANGRQCARCCPGLNCEDEYQEFPDCTPIVKHGTLSAWGNWSEWRDLGSCGTTGQSGYNQERSRYRTCDDSTKNRHGKTCRYDVLEEKESRFHKVCQPITGYGLHTSCNDYYAGTNGKIRFAVKQNGAMCESGKKTIDSPGGCKELEVSGSFGCDVWFDMSKPIEIRALSDSANDAKADHYYVKFGDKKRSWTGKKMTIHKNGERNPWHWADEVKKTA